MSTFVPASEESNFDIEAAAFDNVEVLPVEEAVDAVEVVAAVPRIAPCPVPWRHPIKFVAWVITTAFGLVSLVMLLAVLAAIPVLNFLALGYLLEVEGRMARTGRFRDIFPLLHDAPRIGTIVLGFWLFLLPLRLLSGAVADASLIDPDSAYSVGMEFFLLLVWGAITVHLILALARGGTLSCFLRPFKNLYWFIGRLRAGDYLETAGQHVSSFLQRLRIRHHFWLGLRGFSVALIWLVIPSAMYAAVRRPEGGQVLLMLVGGLMLALVLSWAPFLQARFVAENRFAAGFQLRKVRELNRHAPIAWMFSTVLLYLLALPLYLFKIALTPQDAMWVVTLVFVVSMYPTRVVTGWAYQRAVRKQREGKRSHILVRLLCSVLQIALLGIFVFILYFTQFLGQQGKLELFRHHALLLPSPF